MKPYYEQDGITLHCGDCVDVMRSLGNGFASSIVTDPPYALTNRVADVPACDACGRQCGGSDKVKAGDPCPRCGVTLVSRRTMAGAGFMGKDWDTGLVAFSVEVWREALRVAKPGAYLLAFGGTRTFHRLACAIEDAGWDIRDTIMWVYGTGFPKSLDVSKAIDKAAGAERKVVGRRRSGIAASHTTFGDDNWKGIGQSHFNETAPATEDAKRWAGWGTALKPAWEPIIVARKPLVGAVAANVTAHGTGALNIDGCRVGDEVLAAQRHNMTTPDRVGRWPANLIHDGSDEVTGLMPNTKSPTGTTTRSYGAYKTVGGQSNHRPCHDSDQTRETTNGYGDSGSAARFFYCAKASKKDRGDGNNHPTVKPTDLMRYLCRLVTPPDGIVLDPFMGSGSTLVAAKLEGFRAAGIDLSSDYCGVAAKRLGETE